MHISKLTEMIETTNKTIRQEGEELLKKDFQEMFEKHPKLEWVAWQQYTPFFNDGDVCTFSVGDLYYRLEGDEQQDDLCDYNYAARTKPARPSANGGIRSRVMKSSCTSSATMSRSRQPVIPLRLKNTTTTKIHP